MSVYIIADAHITNNNEYNEVMDVINNIRRIMKPHDKIILLGDFIDFTQISPAQLNWKIEDFDNCIYVIGNHDIIIRDLDIEACDKYEYDGIVFMHGHKIESLLHTNVFISPDSYNNLFKRLFYSKSSTAKLYNMIWKIIKNMTVHRDGKQLSIDLMNEIKKHGNMIIGHTHYELFDKNRKCLICEDWKNNKTIYKINISEFKSNGIYYKLDGELNVNR
jgi:predicted phosphodiesterase